MPLTAVIADGRSKRCPRRVAREDVLKTRTGEEAIIKPIAGEGIAWATPRFADRTAVVCGLPTLTFREVNAKRKTFCISTPTSHPLPARTARELKAEWHASLL
jgi:hypothetical protein